MMSINPKKAGLSTQTAAFFCFATRPSIQNPMLLFAFIATLLQFSYKLSLCRCQAFFFKPNPVTGGFRAPNGSLKEGGQIRKDTGWPTGSSHQAGYKRKKVRNEAHDESGQQIRGHARAKLER